MQRESLYIPIYIYVSARFSIWLRKKYAARIRGPLAAEKGLSDLHDARVKVAGTINVGSECVRDVIWTRRIST